MPVVLPNVKLCSTKFKLPEYSNTPQIANSYTAAIFCDGPFGRQFLILGCMLERYFRCVLGYKLKCQNMCVQYCRSSKTANVTKNATFHLIDLLLRLHICTRNLLAAAMSFYCVVFQTYIQIAKSPNGIILQLLFLYFVNKIRERGRHAFFNLVMTVRTENKNNGTTTHVWTIYSQHLCCNFKLKSSERHFFCESDEKEKCKRV